jgi:ubiquinone/menaquinone biosynthesis C-methylase UbiE
MVSTLSDVETEEPGTYIIDAESTAELARQLHRGQLTTRALGGLLPELPGVAGIQDVLDVACGPGGWVLELAETYPQMRIVGIDISHTMIEYARSLAATQQLSNVSFQVMDALKPLAFSDESFDLINARCISSFMPAHSWPAFLQECLRICRPGGIIRLTEADLPISNKPACEEISLLLALGLTRCGHNFSSGRQRLDVLPMLERLLRDAGCVEIQMRACAENMSAGTARYEDWYQNGLVSLKLLEPFFARVVGLSSEAFNRLYEEARCEAADASFCSLQFFLTVWGQKPPHQHHSSRGLSAGEIS